MKVSLALLGLFMASVLGLVIAGCSGPSVPERERAAVQGGLLERTTPENVLWNLRLIYAEKDHLVDSPEDAHYWAERYRELFHSGFKFYFLPEDEPPGLGQAWWGTEDEVGALESLLVAMASGVVDEIYLSWTVNPPVPDRRVDEQSGELLHPDWMWVHVTSVLLDIVQGENIYRVSNASADFYFAADPADSTLWVVTEWWDGRPSGWQGVMDVPWSFRVGELTSWGRMKTLFR